MDDSLRSAISHVPLFSGLSRKDIDALSEIMIVRTFEKGETIVYEEDEENQTFFIIASGSVYVAVMTSEGKQSILATLKKDDFFGEMALLDGEPRSASVIASEQCRLFMLYRKPFLEILKKYPQIAIQMLVAMSRRLRNSNKQINTLSLMSVYGRVADVILKLAKEHGEQKGTEIIIHDRPTHQIIADMAGTSRETVSRILSQLQKKNYLILDKRKMIILDERKLYV